MAIEDKDEVCIGNGTLKDDEVAKNLEELFNKKDPKEDELNEAWTKYVNAYNFNNKNLLKFVNIRTCGLEKYLVYKGEQKVGIYVPEEINRDEIHFPKYLKDMNKFYKALENNTGKIIAISRTGLEESSLSSVKGAQFGEGSDPGSGLQEIKLSEGGSLEKEPELPGIMLGQIIAEDKDGNLNFRILGEFNEESGEFNKPKPENCGTIECDSSTLKEFFEEKLKLQEEDKNKFYATNDNKLKIYTNNVFGDSTGKQNFDFRIEKEHFENLKTFCGDDLIERFKDARKALGRNNISGVAQRVKVNKLKKNNERGISTEEGMRGRNANSGRRNNFAVTNLAQLGSKNNITKKKLKSTGKLQELLEQNGMTMGTSEKNNGEEESGASLGGYRKTRRNRRRKSLRSRKRKSIKSRKRRRRN